MEIILKEDIVGLGYKNEIITVKNGYGRNYLIPQGMAILATPSAKKVLAENLRQQAHKLVVLKEKAEKAAAQFEGVEVVIAAKVSSEGQLYGSVGAAAVAEELAKKGIEVDRKIITMRDAKKIGDYEAIVHFHKEVEVKVPVKVIAENAPVEEAVVEAPKAEEEKAEPVQEVETPAEETEETPAEA